MIGGKPTALDCRGAAAGVLGVITTAAAQSPTIPIQHEIRTERDIFTLLTG
jgi:hypothetical protein